MPKVYLDACCLNRPFDDQTQERIRLESEAALLVMKRFQERGDWVWVGSDALEYEIDQIPDPERRRRVRGLASFCTVREASGDVADRAKELQGLGFKAVDALHVACAEKAGCDVVLTTDDRMLRAAKRNADRLHVQVKNPVEWLLEEGES